MNYLELVKQWLTLDPCSPQAEELQDQIAAMEQADPLLVYAKIELMAAQPRPPISDAEKHRIELARKRQAAKTALSHFIFKGMT